LPAFLVVHHADLEEAEVQILDGITITTPYRAIVDGHRANIGPALVRQAIADGQKSGWLSAGEAEKLRKQLLSPSAKPRTHTL
jgi:hypothetical protein